jgi:hypothetical protein
MNDSLVSQPRKTEDVEDDEVKGLLLRIPGSFDFEDHGSGCGYRRSVWCCRYAREFVAADAAEMMRYLLHTSPG